jgi:hypothetical protein
MRIKRVERELKIEQTVWKKETKEQDEWFGNKLSL